MKNPSLMHVPEGACFQLFMTGYLIFRFFIDFMKPTPHPYIGLNNIQVACLAGLIYYCFLLRRWLFNSLLTRKESFHVHNK